MPARARGLQPLSEINVTPFVDVMLVLLVIFMITAPLLQHGIAVDLPEVETTPMRLAAEPLTLSIEPDGQTYLGATPVPPEEIETRLRAVFEARGDETLYLRADGDAPYHAVARALAAAQRAGAENIGLVTEPANP